MLINFEIDNTASLRMHEAEDPGQGDDQDEF